MKFVRDARSFQAPLDRAVSESVAAIIAAGVTVQGAETRIRAALDEKNALELFIERVTELLKTRSF
ncbi:MAG: hypothetical protein JNK52_04950, partial [Zoogloeaceae bacterium]|nr:hypothetical protein [Zoogloeaceae bacterium]